MNTKPYRIMAIPYGSLGLWLHCVSERLATHPDADALLASYFNMTHKGHAWTALMALPGNAAKHHFLSNILVCIPRRPDTYMPLLYARISDYLQPHLPDVRTLGTEPIDPLPILLHACKGTEDGYRLCPTDQVMYGFVANFFIPKMAEIYTVAQLKDMYPPQYNAGLEHMKSINERALLHMIAFSLGDTSLIMDADSKQFNITRLHTRLKLTQEELAIWFRAYYAALVAGPLEFKIRWTDPHTKWGSKVTDARTRIHCLISLIEVFVSSNAGPYRRQVTTTNPLAVRDLTVGMPLLQPGLEWFKIPSFEFAGRIELYTTIYQHAGRLALTTPAAITCFQQWVAALGIDPQEQMDQVISALMPEAIAILPLQLIIASYL